MCRYANYYMPVSLSIILLFLLYHRVTHSRLTRISFNIVKKMQRIFRSIDYKTDSTMVSAKFQRGVLFSLKSSCSLLRCRRRSFLRSAFKSSNIPTIEPSFLKVEDSPSWGRLRFIRSLSTLPDVSSRTYNPRRSRSS